MTTTTATYDVYCPLCRQKAYLDYWSTNTNQPYICEEHGVLWTYLLVPNDVPVQYPGYIK